jgi:hypothetical protein
MGWMLREHRVRQAEERLAAGPLRRDHGLVFALLAGHNQTATTEPVYRHQIVPALTRGAEVMDQIFG